MQKEKGSSSAASIKCYAADQKRIQWLLDNSDLWAEKDLSTEDKDKISFLMKLGGYKSKRPIFHLLEEAKEILDRRDDHNRQI